MVEELDEADLAAMGRRAPTKTHRSLEAGGGVVVCQVAARGVVAKAAAKVVTGAVGTMVAVAFEAAAVELGSCGPTTGRRRRAEAEVVQAVLVALSVAEGMVGSEEGESLEEVMREVATVE